MLHQRFEVITADKIDVDKWDDCITKSEGCTIYATYNYLQHMADNWLGIVINNYEAVMPVPYRKKFGIKYCYNAPFIQQLGMFGNFTSNDFKTAFAYVVKHIWYGDLYFNWSNNFYTSLPEVTVATNLIIPLQKNYDEISKSYSNHLKKELKKAAKQSLQYVRSDDAALAIKTYQQLYAQRLPAITSEIYKRFTALAIQLFGQKKCFIRQVTDKQNNLLAIALFLQDDNRIYNILPSVNDEGKKVAAMHFLIDNVLHEFENTNYIFDFEGSDVPGIKTFYMSFGAVNQPYFYYHYNHLPYPIKWLKR